MWNVLGFNAKYLAAVLAEEVDVHVVDGVSVVVGAEFVFERAAAVVDGVDEVFL